MAIKSEAENASSSRTIPRGVYANCILAIDKLLENYDIKDEIQSALKYSYIYPEQSKGGEQVVEVTNMVRKAYAAYKDLNTFIADPTKDLLDGDTSDRFEDSDTDVDEEDLSELDSTPITAAVDDDAVDGKKKSLIEVLRSYAGPITGSRIKSDGCLSHKELISLEDFDKVFRDLLVFSIIRGTHMYMLMVDTGNDSNGVARLVSANLGRPSGDRLLNRPLDKKYNSSVSGERTSERYAFSTKFDAKIPDTNLSPQTLAIFLSHSTPFATLFKKYYYKGTDSVEKYIDDIYAQYRVQTESVDTGSSELIDDSHSDEGNISKGNAAVDDQSMFAVLDYTLFTVESLIYHLNLTGMPINPELVIKFSDVHVRSMANKLASDNGITVQGNGMEDNEKAEVDVRDDNYYLARSGHEEIQPEYSSRIYTRVMNKIAKIDPDSIIDSFDFKILSTTGSITERNLYVDYFRPQTLGGDETNENAFWFLWSTFTEYKRDKIPDKSFAQLQAELERLPKKPSNIKTAKNRLLVDETMALADRGAKEALETAIYKFERTISPQDKSNKALRDTLPGDFEQYFNYDATANFNNDKLVYANLMKTFGIQSQESGRGVFNSEFNPETAIKDYIDNVEHILLECIDLSIPINNKDITRGKGIPTYIYQTESNSTFERNGIIKPAKFVFPSKQDYVNAVNTLLQNLHNSLDTFDTGSSNAVALNDAIMKCYLESFPDRTTLIDLRKASTTVNVNFTVDKQIMPDEDRKNATAIDNGNKVSNTSNNVFSKLLLALFSNTTKPLKSSTGAAEILKTSINNSMFKLGVLHTRIEFLMALREFSRCVTNIREILYKKTLTLIKKHNQSLYDLLKTPSIETVESRTLESLLDKMAEDVYNEYFEVGSDSGLVSFIKTYEDDRNELTGESLKKQREALQIPTSYDDGEDW